MLIVIAGFPGAFISAFFSGSLLIERSSRSTGWACSALRR
jgi:ABC-type microcin C transport system permease subunit YejB